MSVEVSSVFKIVDGGTKNGHFRHLAWSLLLKSLPLCSILPTKGQTERSERLLCALVYLMPSSWNEK